MRSNVRMTEIICSFCGYRSIENHQCFRNCMNCNIQPDRNVLTLEQSSIEENLIECPEFENLHAGRNRGTPWCERCRHESLSPLPVLVSPLRSVHHSPRIVLPRFDSSDSSSEYDSEEERVIRELEGVSINQSLDLSKFSTLNKITADQAFCHNECAICLEDFKLGDSVIALECKHFYHDNCLLPWFQCKNSCPLCKKKVN